MVIWIWTKKRVKFLWNKALLKPFKITINICGGTFSPFSLNGNAALIRGQIMPCLR